MNLNDIQYRSKVRLPSLPEIISQFDINNEKKAFNGLNNATYDTRPYQGSTTPSIHIRNSELNLMRSKNDIMLINPSLSQYNLIPLAPSSINLLRVNEEFPKSDINHLAEVHGSRGNSNPSKLYEPTPPTTTTTTSSTFNKLSSYTIVEKRNSYDPNQYQSFSPLDHTNPHLNNSHSDRIISDNAPVLRNKPSRLSASHTSHQMNHTPSITSINSNNNNNSEHINDPNNNTSEQQNPRKRNSKLKWSLEDDLTLFRLAFNILNFDSGMNCIQLIKFIYESEQNKKLAEDKALIIEEILKAFDDLGSYKSHDQSKNSPFGNSQYVSSEGSYPQNMGIFGQKETDEEYRVRKLFIKFKIETILRVFEEKLLKGALSNQTIE